MFSAISPLPPDGAVPRYTLTREMPAYPNSVQLGSEVAIEPRQLEEASVFIRSPEILKFRMDLREFVQEGNRCLELLAAIRLRALGNPAPGSEAPVLPPQSDPELQQLVASYQAAEITLSEKQKSIADSIRDLGHRLESAHADDMSPERILVRSITHHFGNTSAAMSLSLASRALGKYVSGDAPFSAVEATLSGSLKLASGSLEKHGHLCSRLDASLADPSEIWPLLSEPHLSG